MKTITKSKIKTAKQFFGKLLGKMITDGNERVKELQQKIVDITVPHVDKPIARQLSARKYWNPKPNPARRNCKTLNGVIRHMLQHRGYGMESVPTLDQTKALEKRIGLKVQVRAGKCHVGSSSFIVPINATLDEASNLLDAHLAAKRKGWLRFEDEVTS